MRGFNNANVSSPECVRNKDKFFGGKESAVHCLRACVRVHVRAALLAHMTSMAMDMRSFPKKKMRRAVQPDAAAAV